MRQKGICRTLVSDDEKKAVVVEVNAETDFVAKNEKFQNYVAEVAAQALDTQAADIEAFLAEPWKFEEGKSVNEALAAQIAVIGENMNIRRFQQVSEENGFLLPTYPIWAERSVFLLTSRPMLSTTMIKEMAKNVAMQVAAMKPQYTDRSEISADYIEHEKEILLAQIKNDPKESQKPEKVIEGMINGRINKELKEICLLDQVYVKAEDGKQTVAKYVEQVAKRTAPRSRSRALSAMRPAKASRRSRRTLQKKLQSRWECNHPVLPGNKGAVSFFTALFFFR